MIVQNDGDKIRLSDEFRYEILTREEAILLREEITEAIKMCPVSCRSSDPH